MTEIIVVSDFEIVWEHYYFQTLVWFLRSPVPAGGRRMECSRRVIAVSLECIKTLIVKLDKEGDLGSDGVQYVMSQFSPSEAADNPLDMLDSRVYQVTWSFR